jgi:hypothetical protein
LRRVEVAGRQLLSVYKSCRALEARVHGIGSDKVTRSFNGKVDFQALLIGGQEYPAKELVAVWGRDLNTYWTADLRGNVFHFDGTQWKLIVRGPDFKTRQKFEALWPTRDGSLIAVTNDNVYALE